MKSKVRAFTLIELLVVIAIIGILAGMLFPVFARAREAARKIQCLSNVKNIAMAIQMYLTDYDRLLPREHRSEVLQYFENLGCSSNPTSLSGATYLASGGNPYLRWQVVLDEYIKNRDVWRCPSAKIVRAPSWIIPGDWFATAVANQGLWGPGASGLRYKPCGYNTFPPGWGGIVTDSWGQGGLPPMTSKTSKGREAASGAFEWDIACTEWNSDDLNISQVEDPSWYVICGDTSKNGQIYWVDDLMFPDTCRTHGPVGVCCSSDWANCPWTQDCGIYYQFRPTLWNDPTQMKKRMRHLGGSNLGFLDGHAKWWPAEQLMAKTQGGQNWVQDVGKQPPFLTGFVNNSCLCRYCGG